MLSLILSPAFAMSVTDPVIPADQFPLTSGDLPHDPGIFFPVYTRFPITTTRPTEISDSDTPITIQLTPSKIPLVGEQTILHIEVNSISDAPGTNVTIILPEGAELIRGSFARTLDLRANTPESVEMTVKFTRPGDFKIIASAHKVIDRDNSWGDLDVLYLTIGTVSSELSPLRPVLYAEQAQSGPEQFRSVSGDSKPPRYLNTELQAITRPDGILLDRPGGPAEPPVSAPPRSRDPIDSGTGVVTVKGQWTYYTKVVGGEIADYRDTENTRVPLKQAYVTIYNATSLTLLGSGYTDNNGNFSIQIANPYPHSFYVYTWAYSKYTDPGSINRELRVVSQGSTLSGITDVWNGFAGPFSTTAGTHSQDTGSWFPGIGTDLDHAFMLFQDLIRTRDFLGWDAGSSTILWNPTSTDGNYYIHGGQIHLTGETYKAADTSVHEFSHNYVWTKKGDWSNTCPGTHYITSAYNSQCAYAEGWANFFSLAVNGNPTKTWASGSSINLDTPTWGSPGWDNGDTCEGRVAGALWDMYDSGVSEAWDVYDFPYTYHDAAMIQNPGWTFPDFWTAWVTLGYSSDALGSIYQNTIDYFPPRPVGDFSGTPISGTTPLSVQFTDMSSNNPSGRAWYFGDETFTSPWTQVNAGAGWTPRAWQSSVVLPDASILLMGGMANYFIRTSDTWRSTDTGANWTLVNASSGWSPRYGQSSVVLPDGSILLMGGYDNGGTKNDTWRSTTKGATWTLVNASSGWPARYQHQSELMPDGSIILMGGADLSRNMNDTWRSTDNGTTWRRQNTSSGWSARRSFGTAALPDGSIVLFGGYDSSGMKNDTWRSGDNGAVWTVVNSSAWPGRYDFSSVAMPDGSIVLMGGVNTISRMNDVWRSTDTGSTWTEVNAGSGWPARYGQSSVVMPDGSIVLLGGTAFGNEGGDMNDVWRLQTAGSTGQDPLHTYTASGNYTVTLQVFHATGYTSTRKAGFVTVSDQPVLPGRTGIYKDGSWYMDMNGDGVWNAGDRNYGYGAPLWTPVSGDWNGDNKTEIGVYRDGSWYLDYDASGWWSGSDKNYGFGALDWTPVVGDWNGNGYDKIGVYKDGAWYLDYDGNGMYGEGDRNFAFGGAGWEPVIGKWTSDGKSKIGVYKDGIYYIDYNGDNVYNAGDRTIVYGSAGSRAVTGDWNADGLTKVGTQTGNTWYLDYDGLGAVNASTRSYTFGSPEWFPVIGDWDDDSTDTIGIYLDGAWYLDVNGNGVWDAGTDKNFAFGAAGWTPVVGTWN